MRSINRLHRDLSLNEMAEDSTQGSPDFQFRTSAKIIIVELLVVVNGLCLNIIFQALGGSPTFKCEAFLIYYGCFGNHNMSTQSVTLSAS